jgi:hypothetical protein
MVQLTALWLPILLAAVFVFIVSSVIHMVLGYHRSDFGKLPSEDEAMEALRKLDIPPGDYSMPCPSGPQGMKSPEFQEKMKTGPVALLTIMKSGEMSMGKSLVLWFLYCAIVGLFAGYVAAHTVGANESYLKVFRVVGTTAFAGYSLALLQNSIWLGRKWSTTLKSVFDGLIYALITAGTFGWLWPRQ